MGCPRGPKSNGIADVLSFGRSDVYTAVAGSEAEEWLVDALNGARLALHAATDLQDEPELSGDAAHLVALDRFADEDIRRTRV